MPKSVRRLHRSSQLKRLFSEAVDDEPCLTVQNPADVVGETVFDCRPSVLPVSIPLLGLGPGMMAETRPSKDLQPLEETGKSIMDMDTNKITINRIIGFEWDEAGTDLEDEGLTAVASPVEVVTNPFGRGDNFDFDLAKVMCDVSVIPSIITPIEELEVQPPSRAAEYAAPATPAFENVVESPGYTVPEDSGLAWIQGFAPVSETVLDEEGGHWLSLKDPPPLPVPTSAATPVVVPVTEGPAVPTMPPTPDDTRIKPGTGGVRQADRAHVFVVESTAGSTSSPLCQATEDIGPDLTREGPFDASEVIPEPGQSTLVLNSMPGCQFRMTSYDDRDTRDDLDPEYGIHLHDPRMMEYMGAPESARLLGRSPVYWLEHMGRDRAVAAALRLHHDASLIMTNVQVMSQFVTSLNRTASEVMRTVYDMEMFPTDAVNFVTPGRRVRGAAHYMAAMGLWRPTSAPVFPGPISLSSCNSCMACDDCFPDAPQ